MEGKTREILQEYPPNKRENLITILQEIQKAQGYLTEESAEMVSGYLSIPVNKIYGVAAFYDEFRFRPRGMYHIEICKGSTCHLAGKHTFIKELEKQLRVKAGQTRRDKKVSLEIVHCLGACHLAPLLKVNGKVYTEVSAEALGRIIQEIKEKTE